MRASGWGDRLITCAAAMRVSFLRIAVLLLMLTMASLGWAADHIVERAYLEDASGELTLAQAQTQPWTPFTGVLARGYTSSAVWLRLRIAPQTNQDGKLILRIRPAILDHITLFDPYLSPRRRALAH